MNNIYSKIISIIILLVSIGTSFSQSSINSGGGDLTGTGGTASFSIGQVVYTSNTSPSGTIEQGVQHAYEIYTVSTDHTEAKLNAKVFPNPVNGNLNLQIDGYKDKNLSYYLFDTNGKLIGTEPIEDTTTNIETKHLPQAVYLLELRSKTDRISCFKIIRQ